MDNRREFIRCSAVAALSVLALPKTATAIPVIDAGGIAQIVIQAGEVWAQLQATQAQVDALRRSALQLDPRSYRSVQDLLAANEVNFLALTRDLQTMGYSFERINDRFRRLFPDDQAVKNMTPRQAQAASREMNKEIYSSALVAARTQTTLRTIEDNNSEARNILSRSEGNGSQVAQLQSALQMLGLIHQNLVSITQMISASGRVTSNVAVRGVTERRIERERATRMLRGHDRSEPIPEVDRRFLRSW